MNSCLTNSTENKKVMNHEDVTGGEMPPRYRRDITNGACCLPPSVEGGGFLLRRNGGAKRRRESVCRGSLLPSLAGSCHLPRQRKATLTRYLDGE